MSGLGEDMCKVASPPAPGQPEMLHDQGVATLLQNEYLREGLGPSDTQDPSRSDVLPLPTLGQGSTDGRKVEVRRKRQGKPG